MHIVHTCYSKRFWRIPWKGSFAGLLSGAGTQNERNHRETSQLMARVERRHIRANCFSEEEWFGLSLFGTLRMGAIDMFYRFLCCFSLGDAAKNGQNDSSNSGSKAIWSQGHGLDPTSPSSSQHCWCGFLSRERKREISSRDESGKSGQLKQYFIILYYIIGGIPFVPHILYRDPHCTVHFI